MLYYKNKNNAVLHVHIPRTGGRWFVSLLNHPDNYYQAVDPDLANSHLFDQNEIEFLNSQNISLPIRFHDMNEIYQEIPINNYEFHLSFKDVNDYQTKSVISKIVAFTVFVVRSILLVVKIRQTTR